MKIGNIDIKKAYFGNKELSNTNAFLGTVSVIDEAPEPQTDGLCFTAIEDTTISLKQYGSSKPSGADDPFAEETGDTNTELFQTSTDGLHWNTYTIGDAITLSTGDKLYWKGNVDTMATSTGIYKYFTTTGKVDVSGNIMSLLGTDTLASYAFAYLFNGTKIVNANELSLPATTLAENCYRYMFNNCLSLVNAPELPATTLAGYCYRSMFQGCVALVNAPELPATTLRQQSYNSMFFGCTSLVNAPELPATTLASYCYNAMFNGCTSLVNAPELPATTLASNCYTSMFNGCTSLVNAPALPAVTLESSCYKNMFYNCSALNKITTCATSWDTTAASNWVYGVAATGDFYNLGQATIPTDENGIPEGWVEHTEIEDLCFTAIEDTTISLKQIGTDSRAYDLSTSKNGVKWTSYTIGDEITLTAGEKLYWKGNNTSMSTNSSAYKRFTTTGKVDVSGNIMSLLGTDTLSSYAFAYLFFATKIVNANELLLPATELATYCYNYMFGNCSSLVNAPALPATTLTAYCYQWMFIACTSLVTAPELPATTLASYCYRSMFQGCVALVNAPELPATTLASYCYQYMFKGCTSLVTAPELPATTLANYCYQNMFYGCTSLVNAPELPATTLANYCYESMFSDCTSLVNAPELPATTLVKACYRFMFQECNSLNKITTYATSWNTSYAASWVDMVAATGDFYNLGQATIPTDENGIPEGWTEHTEIEPETDGLCFTALEDTTISLKQFGTDSRAYDLSTSTDGVNWNTYTIGDEITLSTGDKLYWKGNNTSMAIASYVYKYFTTSGAVDVSGNIMSLLGTDTLSDYAFFSLFRNTKILDASELLLPATTLATACYYGMFFNCNSLSHTPELPATTLAESCYGNMFNGCWGLENTPELPATELVDNCYTSMFARCTSLVNAPELPATALAYDCYGVMFAGCSSLVNAPELPATELAESCYQYMFSGCTSLVNTPELPATELVDSCYDYMFENCTSLNKITTYATSWSALTSYNWVSGVSSTGDFYNLGQISIPTGVNGIPEGWVEHTEIEPQPEPTTLFSMTTPETTPTALSDMIVEGGSLEDVSVGIKKLSFRDTGIYFSSNTLQLKINVDEQYNAGDTISLTATCTSTSGTSKIGVFIRDVIDMYTLIYSCDIGSAETINPSFNIDFSEYSGDEEDILKNELYITRNSGLSGMTLSALTITRN